MEAEVLKEDPMAKKPSKKKKKQKPQPKSQPKPGKS
jgi:hypothetical protein